MKPCAWEDAIISVAKVLDSTPADRMAAVAGGLVDAEVEENYSNIFTKSLQVLTNIICKGGICIIRYIKKLSNVLVADRIKRFDESTWVRNIDDRGSFSNGLI